MRQAYTKSIYTCPLLYIGNIFYNWITVNVLASFSSDHIINQPVCVNTAPRWVSYNGIYVGYHGVMLSGSLDWGRWSDKIWLYLTKDHPIKRFCAAWLAMARINMGCVLSCKFTEHWNASCASSTQEGPEALQVLDGSFYLWTKGNKKICRPSRSLFQVKLIILNKYYLTTIMHTCKEWNKISKYYLGVWVTLLGCIGMW